MAYASLQRQADLRMHVEIYIYKYGATEAVCLSWTCFERGRLYSIGRAGEFGL